MEGLWEQRSCRYISAERSSQDKSLDEFKMTPVLARIAQLPERMGVEKTDCGHGEGHTMALAQEILPPLMAYITVSNSKAIIGLTRALRDASIPTMVTGTSSGS